MSQTSAQPQPDATLPAWARAWILETEGGYSNDPADPGRETKFGISKRAHPEVDIAGLTQARAVEIYGRAYWRPIRGAELPSVAALAVFDAAVLHGVTAAVAMLQRTLLDLRAYSSRFNVAVDGIVGPHTIAAARTAFAPGKSGAALAHYLAERVLYVAAITRREPSQQRFLRGWARRFFLLGAACARLEA